MWVADGVLWFVSVLVVLHLMRADDGDGPMMSLPQTQTKTADGVRMQM